MAALSTRQLFEPNVSPQAAFNASRRRDLHRSVLTSGALRAFVTVGEIALLLWMFIASSFALVVAAGFFG
jgi:hypothetical protein